MPHGRPGSVQAGCQRDCAKIIHYYGSRPFKCKFPRCEFWRHGFEARNPRNKHELTHDLPLKCHVDGCKFGQIGFLSETMRQKHLQEGHRNVELEPAFNAGNIIKDDVEALLFDLVRENHVAAVREVLSTLSKPTKKNLRHGLQLLAASSASAAMLETLEGREDQSFGKKKRASFKKAKSMSFYQYECIERSILAQNRGTLEFFFERCVPFAGGPDVRIWQVSIMCQLVSIDWVAGTESWCRWHRAHQDTTYNGTYTVRQYIRGLLGNKDPVKAAATHSAGERQLLYIWRQFECLPQFEEMQALTTEMLKHVSEFSCSITLAEYLLERGASINARTRRGVRTALHCAAGRDSAEGAQMMRFLLLQGADPEADREMAKNAQHGHILKSIRDEVGPQWIHTWLKKSWDELVEETRRFRENNKVEKASPTRD